MPSRERLAFTSVDDERLSVKFAYGSAPRAFCVSLASFLNERKISSTVEFDVIVCKDAGSYQRLRTLNGEEIIVKDVAHTRQRTLTMPKLITDYKNPS
jgi:hypothetical protein